MGPTLGSRTFFGILRWDERRLLTRGRKYRKELMRLRNSKTVWIANYAIPSYSFLSTATFTLIFLHLSLSWAYLQSSLHYFDNNSCYSVISSLFFFSAISTVVTLWYQLFLLCDISSAVVTLLFCHINWCYAVISTLVIVWNQLLLVCNIISFLLCHINCDINSCYCMKSTVVSL